MRNPLETGKKLVDYVDLKRIKKAVKYVQKNGIRGLKNRIRTRMHTEGISYEEWFEQHKVTEDILQEQRRENFEKNPKISIIVPTYKTPVRYLREMVDSVISQSYVNWELCIADGSEGDAAVEKELKRYGDTDERIKYCILERNLGIAGNTNEALKLATGDYVGLFDHDDILAPNALYEIVKALQEHEYDILYTDEDKITGDKNRHLDPNFKPDFSMDLFRCNNYITHFFVVKTEIIKEIGGFRSEYDGSQDYDLMFRCIENADSIKHIPMILYHWRVHMNSVAGDPASKKYAYDAGKRAIEDHLRRTGTDASVEHLGVWGMYHVKYHVQGMPLISVIIINKDQGKALERCIHALFARSSYQNFEIIIVDNKSTEKKTFAYYKKIRDQYSNVKVTRWDGADNPSAMNNLGAKRAGGEYLLFLDCHVELLKEQSVEEMLGCCMRPEVGAVGAKILYQDDTIFHAGMIVGMRDYVDYANRDIGRDDYGYMGRALMNGNYSAVTNVCMVTKKDRFFKVGGFDEMFTEELSGVDYCLRLRTCERLIVYNAFAEWRYMKAKGSYCKDKKEKNIQEVAKFRERWNSIYENGDPYYNKNFSKKQLPFTLD